jgi:hypothetical protein
MSQENVELVRRALEASTRRDNDATFGLYDPEVEIHGLVDGAVYRGLTGVRVFFRDWFDAWSELSYDAEARPMCYLVVHQRESGSEKAVLLFARCSSEAGGLAGCSFSSIADPGSGLTRHSL